MSIRSRKENHLNACLNSDVQSEISNGFENYRLINESCPEEDFSALNFETDFLNHKISFPLMISSMTGGTDQSEQINRNLARAAQAMNLPFALGSQRIYLVNQKLETLKYIREEAPDIPILANIGAVQLNYGWTKNELLKLVDSVNANALILHFNPLQEVFQPEGNTDFRGLIDKIKELCADFPVPIVAKEVGFGISVSTAAKMADAGIRWIDIAGAGGTSWAKIEALSAGQKIPAETIAPFGGWGIPTAVCIDQIHQKMPEINLIASGGIRNGIEMRKACLLGAKLCGIAIPLLRSALENTEAVITVLERYIFQYRAAVFTSSAVEKI